MAKYRSQILCGFDIQTGLGTYNAALAAITAAGTWDGDSSATDEGLLLGDAEADGDIDAEADADGEIEAEGLTDTPVVPSICTNGSPNTHS